MLLSIIHWLVSIKNDDKTMFVCLLPIKFRLDKDVYGAITAIYR